MRGFELRELSPALGVEIRGLDLSRPLSDEQRRELGRLFDRHHLLLFRGQQVGDDDHLRRPFHEIVAGTAYATA